MTAPDPRHAAVADYLLDEIEVYCRDQADAERYAGEIIAAVDAAGAAEITRLREEVAELRTSVIAFGAPWAVAYAQQHGAPTGALHHRHYDILTAAGARMVDFTRWVPDDDDRGG